MAGNKLTLTTTCNEASMASLPDKKVQKLTKAGIKTLY